jgi:hypothetical protein
MKHSLNAVFSSRADSPGIRELTVEECGYVSGGDDGCGDGGCNDGQGSLSDNGSVGFCSLNSADDSPFCAPIAVPGVDVGTDGSFSACPSDPGSCGNNTF